MGMLLSYIAHPESSSNSDTNFNDLYHVFSSSLIFYFKSVI
nr:hypothetical protein B11C_10165 [Bartonella sp. 1-1C]